MFKLVIDLEMADKYSEEFRKNKIRHIHEIIEIGAVILDEENNIIERFKSYVKPKYSVLTSKIKELTGITEENLENADSIELALEKLVANIKNITNLDNIVVLTWSEADVTAINKEIELKKLDMPELKTLCNGYEDLQIMFGKRVKFQNKVNLEKALEYVGVDFDGQAHDALIDAENTAKLYIAMNDNEEVKRIIDKINQTMTYTKLTSSIGSMIDFSKFSLEVQTVKNNL